MSSNVSFALNLQSDRGQKSITSRIENEVRILDNLRKFLLGQIKAGKDYSGTVGCAATVTMKTLVDVNNATESGGSVVNKVSLHILEEVQSAVTTIKENVEFLHGTTLPNLNELIAEKKLMGKLAAEHYHRIKARLDQFGEKVHKSKTEYVRNFTLYETARTKYEDQCTKGKGTKKTDEMRDKFFNARRRLNVSHAEYLIVIHEASEYDRDFRTILLPGLLQAQQTWLEKQVSHWKEILDQIWKNGPWLSSLQSKMKDFEFNNEYLELISKHKSQPLQSMNFQFEPAQHSSLPVNQALIIVDSGTVDFLRSKLSDLNKRIKSTDLHSEEKQDQQSKQKNSLLDEVRQIEINELRCESDRARSTKSYIETHFKGKITDSPMSTRQSVRDDTISLISDNSSIKKSTTNRFATFLRNARLKKTVSFEEEVHSIGANPSGNESSQHVPNVAIEKGMTSLLEEHWFHGVLPREDVVRLLRQDGDYLIRETTKNEERQIVLSVFWNGPKHFIIQTTPDGQFRFEGPIFPTVKQLLSHYVENKEPITNRSGALVKKPVKRENWELNNDDVELIEKIGKGNFGDVYKASYNGQLVAVKTCKVNLPEEQKKKFLQEGRILKQYDHPNIVRLVGICVQKQPIMIVMELVPGGSLLTHLKGKGGTMTAKSMSKLCLDAAAGMKYLEEKGCIHRDLAARNCLLDSNGSVKISDFGMSREEKEYTVSDGMKQIPIKWTAPEALNYGKYTPLSDVWSYGILMWEIFSRGQTPYQGMTNAKSREMVEAGYRMPAPDGMPDVIYQLMARCWQYEPEQRPRFSEIYSELLITIDSDLI